MPGALRRGGRLQVVELADRRQLQSVLAGGASPSRCSRTGGAGCSARATVRAAGHRADWAIGQRSDSAERFAGARQRGRARPPRVESGPRGSRQPPDRRLSRPLLRTAIRSASAFLAQPPPRCSSSSSASSWRPLTAPNSQSGTKAGRRRRLAIRPTHLARFSACEHMFDHSAPGLPTTETGRCPAAAAG